MTLNDLSIGDSAIVQTVGGEGALRQHFLDMGVIPGAKVQLVKYAPMGDPMELRIHSYELTLRKADAEKISIAPCNEETEEARPVGEAWEPEVHLPGQHMEHPGLGEPGKYHDKSTENPLPEGTTLTFALAGNQNCGKTTLFNQLTGAMSPYSQEEIVTRQFILGEKPKDFINIVDCTNIERNLYLTMQLLELDTPMVVALNFMNEVIDNGGAVRINELEEELGVPVIAVNALNGEGVDELVEHAVHVAKYQEKPLRQDFCDENDHGGAVHRALHAIMHLIEDHAERAEIPLRFAANKLIEGDHLIEEALQLDQNEKETVEHICRQMEQERGLDRSAAIADMRFEFIRKVCSKSVIHPKESKEHKRSQRIDKVLTGKFTAIPIFVVIMAAIFYLTFNVFGKWLQDLIQLGIDKLSEVTAAAMQAGHVHPLLQSLVVDGIFGGVGTVLSFLPIIVILFFFLSLLEDSGYMARIAFVMDRPLRKIGLSGRSIVPMLVGFGCTVPAVMSSRTLPSDRDRKMTIRLTPYMSCSAKIPIYAFFSAAFFPGKSWLVMFILYFIGIIIGVLNAVIANHTAFKGDAVPFVMELPNYRMPGAKNVGRLLWDKAKDFLQRAFTIILLCTMIIWFLQHFSPTFHAVDDSSKSILAIIAGGISPIFRPLGFGDWRIVTSLIAGFLAKESVVSTLSLLFGGIGAVHAALTPWHAASLLVFCLLYTPCVAAIASIRRELGRKWAWGVALGQCVVAWLAAGVVALIGVLV